MFKNNNLKSISIFLLLIISLLIFADNQLERELESGKAIVLIINAVVKKDSEQYADWSHYLNQFSSDVGKNYVFHKLSTDKLNKTVLNADKFNNNYSMIFMKKGKPSYFYKGPIVEPQVYKFVQLMYSGKLIKPKYLKQFSPKEVNIELKQTKPDTHFKKPNIIN